MATRTFTRAEVAAHNTAQDCWIIVDDRVYDVTKFLSKHPGGQRVVVQKAGQDATKEFNNFHDVQKTLRTYGPDLFIGVLSPSEASAPKAKKDAPGAREQALVINSNVPVAPVSADSFGSMLPYGDPNWYQFWHSPYYNASHRRFREYVREFTERCREIMPFCHEWDEAKKFPTELYGKLARAGLLGGVMGAPWPTKFAGRNIAGGTVQPEEFDPFHTFLLVDEIARCGAGGITWGLFAGLSIGLPPILNFGSQYLRDKVATPCLNGEKIICLAITEPSAGSDVANLKTTAVKTEDGLHYIVNGEKKWITNGVFADFFTVAVRTSDAKGMGGLSLLLLERGMPGLTTRQMLCTGVWSSGTTFITMEDVKVPVENLIGKENSGFKYIMYNFNHERWLTCIKAARMARVCLEESFRYSFKRKTFGKRLIDHAVIRNKVAHMARKVESTHAWIEQVTYQLKMMPEGEQRARLGGPIALLKAQTTQTLEYCAREAAQIFGGLAYTRGGQGEKVERIQREVRAYAIPAGSEEIMLDLAVRQAMRLAPKL